MTPQSLYPSGRAPLWVEGPKSNLRLTLLGGKKVIFRGGGPRAQGLVRLGAALTTTRSLERARREMSHLLVVLYRPGNFVQFLFEICWLLWFFSPEAPIQGKLVRARDLPFPGV